MRFLCAGGLGIAVLLLAGSCGMIQRTASVRVPSFDEVRGDLSACEMREVPAVCEERTRSYLKTPRTPDEEAELRYFLLRFLAKQTKHDRVLALLETLPAKAPYLREARRLAAESAFAIGDYEKALDLAFLVYLSLSPDDKKPMSRIVLLSYLHRGDTEKAALWYSKLNEEKRRLSEPDLTVFFGTRPESKQQFEEAVRRLEQPAETEKTAEETPAPAPVEEALPGMVPAETQPAFDGTYRPDWNRVCLFLSEEEKWRKVNEVIVLFFEWFFKEHSKSGIEITTLRYLTADDLPALFSTARAQGCFAGIGPLFSEIAADEFARLSRVTPLPLFAYTPWYGKDPGLLFNFKYVRNQEAADVVAWLIGRGKKRFAIAYPDDLRGRRLRDLYWQTVETAGGVVSDALAFGPGDKALLDDVENLLSLPEGYHGTLYRFKEDNAQKYATPSLMKRALDRIAKVTPMQADFEALIVIGSPEQAAMLLPAFPYKNVEFDYYSTSEKNRVKENQKALKDDFNLSWPINTIAVALPSEVKGDAAFEKRVDKLIDGAVAAAQWQDLGETNEAWKAFTTAFTAKFQRAPYAVEQPLAEIAAFLVATREKAGKGEIAPFVAAISTSPFVSLVGNRPVQFSREGVLSGAGEVFVGVKTKGFLPARDLFKEEKKEGSEAATNKTEEKAP